MIKLHRDPQSGWRYTQDNQYVIHKTYDSYLRWSVRELSNDGSYRLIHRFCTLKQAREYLERLPIYNTPLDGV